MGLGEVYSYWEYLKLGNVVVAGDFVFGRAAS